MKERGIALVAGLVLLVAVSLLAVAAARSMGLSQLQASNLKDNALALENARLAEAWAKSWLFSRADIEREADCSSPCLLPPAIHGNGLLPDDLAYQGSAWWQANGFQAGTHPESGATIAASPMKPNVASWVMEEIHYESTGLEPSTGTTRAVVYYRLLARGRGNNPASIALTETLLARPWGGEYDPAPYPPGPESPGFCAQFVELLACGTLAWQRLR